MLDLLNKTPEELRKMSKLDVHEGYKKIISLMLFDFYVEALNADDEIKTIADLSVFIEKWVATRIKSPNADWNAGDCGK